MEVFEHRPDVPLIDRVKIQAEVLVPLIKGLERELGKDRAHEMIRRTLSHYYRGMANSVVAAVGSSLGAIQTFGEISAGGDAIDIEMRDLSDESMALDITGCRYAQFFQQIGEPELGFLLVCSADFPLTEGIPGVELERTQTIMQGADHCDFRYRFLTDELVPPSDS